MDFFFVSNKILPLENTKLVIKFHKLKTKALKSVWNHAIYSEKVKYNDLNWVNYKVLS